MASLEYMVPTLLLLLSELQIFIYTSGHMPRAFTLFYFNQIVLTINRVTYYGLHIEINIIFALIYSNMYGNF